MARSYLETDVTSTLHDDGGDLLKKEVKADPEAQPTAQLKEAEEKVPADEERDDEEGIPKTVPRNLKFVSITISLMLVVFIIALDTNIIGTAIPSITSQFNSINDVGWYGSAYLLTLMALQPFYGKIYMLFNVKKVFLFALILFEIGSITCATATHSTAFIVGRALSGSGAAGILSGSMTLGSRLVPRDKRPIYISTIMSMYGVASIAGPTLGGVFTDSHSLTWRFCFWINLPCGGTAIICCFFLLEPYELPEASALKFKEKMRRLDHAGAALSIVTTVLLLLALKWGGVEFSWTSPHVLGALIGSVVALAVFASLQLRNRQYPLISWRILRQRTVMSGCLFVCFLNMGIDTHIYYLPIYFQSVDGVSASMSGLRMLPYLATMIVAAIFSACLISRLKYFAPPLILGSAVFAAGSGLLHTLGAGAGAAEWVGYELIAGIGFGMSFQLPYSSLSVVLDSKDLPMGNALIVFFQSLGGALAVSIGQSILSNELLHQLQLSPQIQNPQAIINLGATKFAGSVPVSVEYTVVAAYSYAISKVFLLPTVAGCVAFVCSLFVEWKKL